MEINDLLKNTNAKDIKKLIALLQIISDAQENEEESIDDIEDTEEPVNQSVANKNSKKNTASSSKRINKFLDMPESKMHKDDSSIDKKLITQPPVPRERYFEPISVTCRMCHKTELLSPNLVDNISRYKCNKCSTNPG